MTHTLRDGTVMFLRPIRAADKLALLAGLHALSAESVYRRFLAPKARFTPAELRYLTEVDGHRHLALVAERLDEPGRIVAVGRWVRLSEHPGTAEFAIVVCDELQGRGLGAMLADELAGAAKRHGITRVRATTHSDNRPAMALLHRLSSHLEHHHTGAGVDEVVFDLVA